MNNFFVKFAPWNEKILSGIINKTVKFSYVHEFNDFNEYGFSINHEKFNEQKKKEINTHLEKEITSYSFLKNLRAYSSEVCNEETIKKIKEAINEGRAKDLLNPKEGCLSLLCQNLAFSKVGIFCVSDLIVFDDDSAQLMFAHYAQNLKGIALIYETITNPKTVGYDKDYRSSSGDLDRLLKWLEGEYDDIGDFLCKSKKWEYEKERRIFGKPEEITPTKELNIKLRAILYTPRFSGEAKTLHEINNNFYGGKLKIERIHPSVEEPYFMMSDGKVQKTHDFLKETFSKTPKTPNFNVREARSSDNCLYILSELKKIEVQRYQYSGLNIINIESFSFEKILNDEQYLIYVAINCSNNKLLGFTIGKLIQNQEAYNPGGKTLRIDGFCVVSEDLWKTVGAELIKTITTHAKEKGANKILIECGAHDYPKQEFLNGQNLSLVSNCFVGNVS